MTRLSELALLARQLAAHRAYLVRRALRELAAQGLTRAGEHVPGAARLAARLLPHAPEPHRALARRLEARGDAQAAAVHAAEAVRLARNTLAPSVLPVLRSAWPSRGPESESGPTPPEGLLKDRKGMLTWLAASDLDLAGQLQVLISLARTAEQEGEVAEARALLERACGLDAGRAAEPLRELAAHALRAGDAPFAERCYRSALDLDPRDFIAWAGLGDALRHDPAQARAARERALALFPEADAVLLALEPLPPASGEVAFARPSPGPFEVGAQIPVELRVEVGPPGGTVYVLPPYGGGLSCEPSGRVAVDPGSHVVALNVQVRRPDAVNAGRPWRLRVALCVEGGVRRAELDFSVPDREPGVLYHIVTEDHELYDERESLTPAEAHTTLVAKSALAESLANRAGARWTHMVDVGSLALVEWAAAERPDGGWPEVAHACREHLVDAVAGGNDLGLHLHAFHDPTLPGFCHGLSAHGRDDAVVTDSAFLDTPSRERGFWSRAFPVIGDVDTPNTRAWATWRGIGRLEALGRLADPAFRVALFRAGSYDFGQGPLDAADSIALLERLGVPADSDVPKPRLCHRPLVDGTYPICGEIEAPVANAAQFRLLEVRPEYNVEGDFLADAGVLDRYVSHRVAAHRDAGGDTAPGVHVICAMSHDKFVNWRWGDAWDSLDPEYGDWATIRTHLESVARRPAVRFATAREAVLAWYDRYAPRLIAWRDVESIVLSPPGASAQTYRHGIRLLGRDLAVDPDHPEPVRVTLPAWLHGRIRRAEVERNRRPWPSRRPQGWPALEFEVDATDERSGHRFELVVEAEAGAGIELREAAPQGLWLASGEPYRAARVELPAALAHDGVGRLFEGVSFTPVAGGFEARVSLADGRPLAELAERKGENGAERGEGPA